MNIKIDLKQYIESLPVIDTHEHLENECRQPDWNILSDYTRHYFSCDLISSGLDPAKIEALADPETDIMTKWLSIEKHWNYCRHTGYGQMLDISVQKLYNLPGLTCETVEEAEKGYQALRANPGYSSKILRESCGIKRAMNNIWHLNGDDLGGLFWFVTQIDNWISPDREYFQTVSSENDVSTLDKWTSLTLKTLIDDFNLRGAKALKMAMPYKRTLLFENPTRAEAITAYEKWLQGDNNFSEIKPFQDYVAHKIFRWANEEKLLLQAHTGYQESNVGFIPDSNPAHLTDVIIKYPHIRFDIFHMGFPYQDYACALGKMYPNVRLNMCWTHILSPVTARRALGEWLQTVPLNKIFAFGGDCLFYDGVVGHLKLARRCVTDALSEMVSDGHMTIKEAQQTARMLFYENPKEYYNMTDI